MLRFNLLFDVRSVGYVGMAEVCLLLLDVLDGLSEELVQLPVRQSGPVLTERAVERSHLE